jgi:mycothiol synthase
MTTIENRLPAGLLVRHATMDDLQAVYELVHACDLADSGMPDHTLEEFQVYWASPDIELATDAWTVLTSDGRAVGYGDVDQQGYVRFTSFCRVLPEYRNRGIEAHLLRLTEERAREQIGQAPEGARVTLSSFVSHEDTVVPGIFEQLGYTFVRSHWRMEIKLDKGKAPEVPLLPEGMTVRTLIAGQEERAVFEMIDTAFQDHWGHMPSTFEHWSHWKFDRKSFDPTLWFLAFDGDVLAGGSLCLYEEDLRLGWVGNLAVLRPWRQKGLGMALLVHSFAEFHRRGIYTVGLGVDSQNLTGATRLYERAGMHIALQSDTYQKELRAGKELSTQSIEG